jgi:hypothetical protein
VAEADVSEFFGALAAGSSVAPDGESEGRERAARRADELLEAQGA